jgi:hypothetical protein
MQLEVLFAIRRYGFQIWSQRLSIFTDIYRRSSKFFQEIAITVP